MHYKAEDAFVCDICCIDLGLIKCSFCSYRKMPIRRMHSLPVSLFFIHSLMQKFGILKKSRGFAKTAFGINSSNNSHQPLL